MRFKGFYIADSGGILPEEDAAYLETYLEGVYDSDMVLGRLYDYVMAFDEPTIFFCCRHMKTSRL